MSPRQPVLLLILRRLARAPATAAAETVATPRGDDRPRVPGHDRLQPVRPGDAAVPPDRRATRAPSRCPSPSRRRPAVRRGHRPRLRTGGRSSSTRAATRRATCSSTRSRRHGGERAVRNANDPEHNDVHPTLWRGRIAWARIYGEQRDRKVIVYTKTLTAPRSRRRRACPACRAARREPLADRVASTSSSCGATTSARSSATTCARLLRHRADRGAARPRVGPQRRARSPARSSGSAASRTPARRSPTAGWAGTAPASATRRRARAASATPWRHNLRLRRYGRASADRSASTASPTRWPTTTAPRTARPRRRGDLQRQLPDREGPRRRTTSRPARRR